VLRVTVVVVESGVPSPAELESAQRSNVCDALAAALASNSLSAGPGSAAPEQPQTTKPQGNRESAPSTGGVAGASNTHASPFSAAQVSKNISNPLVIVALAAAVLLLGVAALPQEAIPDPRLMDMLERHRVEVAFAGVAALAGVVVALALG
jgi:hypothetical protein